MSDTLKSADIQLIQRILKLGLAWRPKWKDAPAS